MSEALIAARLRVALAAALPGYADRSDDPAPASAGKLPAFAVLVERTAAAPLSMGSQAEEVTAQALVALLVQSTTPRTAAADAGEIAAAAIRAAGDLDGAVWSNLVLVAASNEVAPAEARLGRADLRYSFSFIK